MEHCCELRRSKMSLSLLKQSMEIFEQEEISARKTSGKNEIPQRLITRGSKQKHRHFILIGSGGSVQQNKLRDIRSELKQKSEKMDNNMRRLLALSQNSVKNIDAEKIVKRAHQGYYVDVELSKTEKESIFTEEDFRLFEEEYLNS